MPLHDQLQDILDSLGGFGPVVWLSVPFSVGLVLDLVLTHQLGVERAKKWLAGFTALSLTIAALWAVLTPERGFLFLHLLFLDNQAIFVQVIVSITAILIIAYNHFSIPLSSLPPPSPHLILGLTIGLFLLTTSVNLLAIYLSLELVSVSSYLLTALSGS
ncbi:MAG: NADH-quinone oxidoreductase subunit N, partial [Rudanella sp.]|nr:NADH-quinone oxidoreductase subunit N [Rudanella sp.]